MAYTSRQLSEMLSLSKLLKGKCVNESKDRLHVIAVIEIISGFIEDQSQAESANNKDLLASLVGAYMFYDDAKNGYIYNSHGALYSGFAEVLNQSKTNKITAREQLIYINKFHQLLEQNQTVLDSKLNAISINPEQLRRNIRKMLTRQLSTLTNSVSKIVNAIPTEGAVAKHMSTLPEDYAKEKARTKSKYWLFAQNENKSRIFLTQLAHVISNERCEDEKDLPINNFTRSQRIKMGALLYIRDSIFNEYWFKSRVTNSVLYNEIQQILNCPNVDNLDAAQQIECIMAFKSYIDDHTKRGMIEEYGRNHFEKKNLLENIDPKLDDISRYVSKMKAKLELTLSTNWPATVTFATVGMLLGGSPGYALGSGMGLGFGEGQTSRPIREMVGSGVSRLATAYFGSTSSAGYFAYLVGDFLVTSTLSRAFAKLFEVIGFGIGGATGALVGFTFDLSYKGFREICVRYLNFYDQHADQMRNADRELVQCLLDLPAELFAPEKQNQIRYAEGTEREMQNKLTI